MQEPIIDELHEERKADGLTKIEFAKEIEALKKFLKDIEPVVSGENRKHDAFDERPKMAPHKIKRAKDKKAKRKKGGKR